MHIHSSAYTQFSIYTVQHINFRTLNSLAPETRVPHHVFRNVAARVLGASEFKVQNLLWWTGHSQFTYVGSVGLELHVFATQCWRAPTAVHWLRYCFIGSCHVGVSRRFSRSISLAVYCLNTLNTISWYMYSNTVIKTLRYYSCLKIFWHAVLNVFKWFGLLEKKKFHFPLCNITSVEHLAYSRSIL